MTTVTMMELRRHPDKVIRRAQRGQRMVLTYRGNPVMRLDPYRQDSISSDDSFYALGTLADTKGEDLTNPEIDRIVYGS